MAPTVQDKDGKPIQEGDEVWTPIRGGKRQGKVEDIVCTEEEAKYAYVKNPPKVFSENANINTPDSYRK